jgi:hypothetical protein
MNSRETKPPKSLLLPALLVPAVLCLAAAAVLTLLTRPAVTESGPAEQLALVVQRRTRYAAT